MKIKINVKSIIVMIIISIISLILFINISFAANTGKITTETARLREQPETDAKVVELISADSEVEILEVQGEWYKVKYNGMTGYVRSDLVETDQKNNVNKTETSQNTLTTNTLAENTTPDNNTATENTISETEEQTTNTENTQTENTAEDAGIVENGKYKLNENTGLKIIPLITSIKLDEINKDTSVTVTELINEWAKVTVEGTEKQGWIRKEKLQIIQSESEAKSEQNDTEKQEDNTQQENTQQENTQKEENTTTQTKKTMYVNSQTVNVRKNADKTADILKTLTINTQVTVLSTENGWAYVDINGEKGYISESLLSTDKQETSRGGLTERETSTQNKKTETETNTTTEKAATAQSSSGGGSVIEYAKQFLGCKYVYGGTSTSGFDCSGFTQYVYKNFGVSLNRTAAAQYSNGSSVTDLQAGDLVMFGKSGINHVGIYIGGGSFIHAANPSRGVTIDSLSTGYYKTNYVGARRVY